MLGSEVLDVVIGVLFVYLTLSFICSAIQEALAAFLKLRSQDLYRGIRTLLDDPKGLGLVRDFYNHPLIDSLFPGDYEPGNHKNLPSYIPARTFALAIMDLAAPSPAGGASGVAGATSPGPSFLESPQIPSNAQHLRDALSRSSALPKKVSQALITLVDAAGNDVAAARANIEQWYDHAMERVASGYKRKTQAIILAVGLLLVVAVNADSISIVTALSTNKAVRDSLVAAANQPSATGDASPGGASLAPAPVAVTPQELTQFPACRADSTSQDCRLEANLGRIRNAGLPVGWVRRAAPGDLRAIPDTPGDWAQKAIGILLTLAAISLGAPFWFDVLSKITTIRSAIKPVSNAPANPTTANSTR
jgi:hypothetical protein